jgi:hypothetical protein
LQLTVKATPKALLTAGPRAAPPRAAPRFLSKIKSQIKNAGAGERAKPQKQKRPMVRNKPTLKIHFCPNNDS